jgi:hypothetical protein
MTRAAAGSDRKLCSRQHLDDGVRKRIFPSDEMSARQLGRMNAEENLSAGVSDVSACGDVCANKA